jgi:hypothetical protein
MRTRFAGFWIVGLMLAASRTAAGAEQFSLEVPGSPGGSSAVVDGAVLRVISAEGQTFSYERRPDLDQVRAGSRMLGYYCREADQYMLWPAAGTGPMMIGAPDGGAVRWRTSRMRVRPIGPPPGGPPTAPPPGGPPAAAPPQGGGPGNLGAINLGADRFAVAQIDTEGRLHFFQGGPAGWDHAEAALAERLVPGAPLALVADPRSNRPLVYTVDGRGRVVEIAEGQRIRRLTDAPSPPFPPGGHLAVLGQSPAVQVFAVDDQGRVWQLDPAAGRHEMVESEPGRYWAGVRLAAVATAHDDQLFLVDVHGNLVRYVRAYGPPAGPWAQEPVAGGFLSGGSVAAEWGPVGAAGESLYVAAVAADGFAYLLRHTGAGWTSETVSTVALPPGAPIDLAVTADGVLLSAVGPDGTWIALGSSGGAWASHPISAGFPPGAEVVMIPSGVEMFAVDPMGRVVVGTMTAGVWHLLLLAPGLGFFPELVSRSVEPRPPLPPATVFFESTHGEELLVRLSDIREPGRPTDHSIRPGESVSVSIDRDAGAELVEVYLVPRPFGPPVTEEHRWPIPPRVLYTAAVYVNRALYSYVDRRKQKPPGSLPDFDVKSPASLGVFPLPAGARLEDGQRIDAYGEARRHNNPGAAVWFGLPAGDR